VENGGLVWEDLWRTAYDKNIDLENEDAPSLFIRNYGRKT